ncbi:MAG: 3-isopropylmalate dehydratase large subunit [Candidatus Omnitrophota bacterium]
MGYTITEKILLDHTDRKSISPGDLIECVIDLALGNDITAPLAITEFERAGEKRVFDNKKIVLVPDHFSPANDVKSAEQLKILREFARRYNIEHYYEIGCMGIEHALIPEEGLAMPGDLIIGADSHTSTYGALGAFSTGVGSTDLAAVFIKGKLWFKVPESIKFIYNGKPNKWVGGKDIILFTIQDIGVDGALYMAMEFTGEAISHLTMDDRFTICNMAIEAGGKNGIIIPDAVTLEYVKEVAKKSGRKKYTVYKSDADAQYSEVKEYDISKLEPQVAFPSLPSNVKPVSAAKNIKIDQVVIGSCTNGRLGDLRQAAKVLKGKSVHKDVRTLVFPATQSIYLQAVKEGLIEIFIKAGCAVSTPTCGPCIGGHMGVLAEGERCIATTNRNFVGRMGHPKSEIYLSNPAVAAASAVKGRIAHPEEVV